MFELSVAALVGTVVLLVWIFGPMEDDDCEW